MEKAERTQYMGAVKKGKADERREELLKEQLSFSLLRLYHLQLHCCRRANSYGCQRCKDMWTVKKGKEEKMNLQSCKTATLLALSSASTISSCIVVGSICLVDWLMERQRENMRTVKVVICLLSCVLLKEDRGTHGRKERSPPEDQLRQR